MNNITVAILAISAVLIFILPRRFVLIPFLAPIIIMGLSERVLVANLNITPPRILLLCGWIRLIIRSEYRLMNPINSIDKILICYGVWAIVSYTLLEQTMSAFVYRLGVASYSIGTFFLVRCYIIDIDDIMRIIKVVLLLVIFMTPVVAIERLTQNNYFSVFENVASYTYLREGKVRCFGSFSHPITLGSFGACLTALAFFMLWSKENKVLGLVGLIASTLIVFFSSSSGPVFSLLAAVFGLFMWRYRKHIRIFVWGFFFTLIGLHLVMKGPVWSLMNKVGVFTGSSTYHRFMIIDRLIANFNEWWLLGTHSTKYWADFGDMTDVSNHYARVAVDGGILALALFIMIIIFCFRHIGKMIALTQDNVNHQKLFWSLGVGMFSYAVSFLGVSLWDQTSIIWFFLIATIASIKYEGIIISKPEHDNYALSPTVN